MVKIGRYHFDFLKQQAGSQYSGKIIDAMHTLRLETWISLLDSSEQKLLCCWIWAQICSFWDTVLIWSPMLELWSDNVVH